MIDDEHHRRHFQHNAEWDLLIERDMFITQLLFGFRQLLFDPQNLFHRGDHRDHDFQVAVGGRAEDRA
ncbi:Uncharacterised protein [Salmonella enterica subsp. enterica serovar Bovismorbificans]|uniref:Uncharacterized protein n=1 Tax=Salmonella enterica subsp. enterica serovar Bovismorbificans TaxID=58097 RepID=A0A655BX51_SALET|nr:Uncharacterised protein [Salmonella enterica subsp. enterica serovar Bovismorbificans]